jgi:hypothetical protein
MNKWVYFATLPVIVVCYAIVLDGTGKPGLLLAMLAGAAVIALWMRSAKATMQEREYRRTYEASRAATCTALCGVLGELEYKITMRDPSAGEFRFKSGNADRWIPRLPVECSASVQQIGDRESEVVIRGRAVLAMNVGATRRPTRKGWMCARPPRRLRARRAPTGSRPTDRARPWRLPR